MWLEIGIAVGAALLVVDVVASFRMVRQGRKDDPSIHFVRTFLMTLVLMPVLALLAALMGAICLGLVLAVLIGITNTLGITHIATNSPTQPSGSSQADFCSSHTCIPDFYSGNGYIVQCVDGEWSHSGGLPGACSYHGGER